jgi:phosphoenolpyruvate-protein kinase (PTS system EI component)
MRDRGFLDGENTIIWTVNRTLSLPAWSFKHLLAISGSLDPAGAYSASTEQSNRVLLVGLTSTSDAATSSAAVVTRAVGCPLLVRTGRHLPSLPTGDVIAGGGTATHSGKHPRRSHARVVADDLDVRQRST